MIDKLISYTLIALVILGCLIAAFAPDAFASDAGAQDASAAVSAEADPPAAAPLENPAAPAAASEGGEAGDSSVPSADDPVGLFMMLLAKAQARAWWPMFGAALMLIVWGLRKAAKDVEKFANFVDGKIGGALFTFAVSFLGMLATAGFAGEAPGWAEVKAAVIFGGVAIGGWHFALKSLLIPGARWAWGKVRG